MLEGEGLISREPGRGIRPVLPSKAQEAYLQGEGKNRRAQLTGLLENLVSMGLRTSVKVVDVDVDVDMDMVTASSAVAAAVEIATGDSVQSGACAQYPRRPVVAHHNLGACRT